MLVIRMVKIMTRPKAGIDNTGSTLVTLIKAPLITTGTKINASKVNL